MLTRQLPPQLVYLLPMHAALHCESATGELWFIVLPHMHPFGTLSCFAIGKYKLDSIGNFSKISILKFLIIKCNQNHASKTQAKQ